MYNKIFTKILDSSIWLEPDSTRIVWLTCIAAMDEDGYCAFATVDNLARRANVSLQSCQKAMLTLEAPEPSTASQDDDGRRLERVDGGWIVLNSKKYRDMVTREVARAHTRERVRRFRQKRTSNAEKRKSKKANASVTQSEAVSNTVSEAISSTSQFAVAAEPHVVVWTKKGVQSDRIYLHRWQLEALIDTLGPHADDFALDLWVAGLSAKATAEGLVLPRNSVWAWVQAELTKEIQTRGLPLATIGNVTDADKLAALIAKGPSVRP